MTADTRTAVEVAGASTRRPGDATHRSHRRRNHIAPYLGAVPVFVYVGIFLLWPTYIVVHGAFVRPGNTVTLDSRRSLTSHLYVTVFKRSFGVSLDTAL